MYTTPSPSIISQYCTGIGVQNKRCVKETIYEPCLNHLIKSRSLLLDNLIAGDSELLKVTNIRTNYGECLIIHLGLEWDESLKMNSASHKSMLVLLSAFTDL